MRMVCPICNERPLEHPANGRPRSTCEGSCARVWAHARRNASRNKESALQALKRALSSLEKMNSPIRLQLEQLIRRLGRVPPSELARLPAAERPDLPLDQDRAPQLPR